MDEENTRWQEVWEYLWSKGRVKGVWRRQWQVDAWGETPENKKSISVNTEQNPEKFTLEISHKNLWQ